MNPKLPASSPRGFTLIELLTVIAIIGILAAIIIPTVGQVRESAKNSRCVSNLRQVGMALRFYLDDNKGYFPLAFNNPPSNTTWDQEIDRYLPKRDKNSWNKGHHQVMQCPGIKWNGVAAGESGNCYSLCGAAMGVSPGSTTSASLSNVKRNISTVKTPSISPWLVDGAQAGASGSGMFYAAYYVTRAQVTTDASANTNVKADFRHGQKIHMAFADGSVQAYSRARILDTFPNNTRFNGLQ